MINQISDINTPNQCTWRSYMGKDDVIQQCPLPNTSLDLLPESILGQSLITTFDNKPLCIDEIEKKYPNRFKPEEKEKLVEFSQDNPKFIKQILAQKHDFRGKKNVHRFAFSHIEFLNNAYKEDPKFINYLVFSKENIPYRFSPNNMKPIYTEYKNNPILIKELLSMKNKDGKYRFNVNIFGINEAQKKYPEITNRFLYEKVTGADGINDYRFNGSDLMDILLCSDNNEKLTKKLLDLKTKDNNGNIVPLLNCKDIINLLFKIDYQSDEQAEEIFNIKKTDGTYPFDFADVKFISGLKDEDMKFLHNIVANENIADENITSIVASTNDENKKFALELCNCKDFPQEKIVPALLRCETKANVEEMHNLLNQGKLEESLNEIPPEFEKPNGNKIPRFIYHITTKSGYLSMLKDKKIKTYDDGFGLTKDGIFAIELSNFFKRWRKSPDWDNNILQDSLLSSIGYKGKDLIILKIPTKYLDKEKLLIRDQNKLFQERLKCRIYPQKYPQLSGLSAIENAKLVKQRKHAIEYIYTDNIPIKNIEKIGELNLNSFENSSDYNSQKPVQSKFMMLLKNTPESKSAEFLDY